MLVDWMCYCRMKTVLVHPMQKHHSMQCYIYNMLSIPYSITTLSQHPPFCLMPLLHKTTRIPHKQLNSHLISFHSLPGGRRAAVANFLRVKEQEHGVLHSVGSADMGGQSQRKHGKIQPCALYPKNIFAAKYSHEEMNGDGGPGFSLP